MLNSILIFFQENSFLLGTFGTIFSGTVWYLQRKLLNMGKKLIIIETNFYSLKEKFIDIEERRIVSLEKKFDELMVTQGSLRDTVIDMKSAIEHAAKGVTRIEDILLSKKFK